MACFPSSSRFPAFRRPRTPLCRIDRRLANTGVPPAPNPQTDIPGGYTTAGQYVQLRVGGSKPAYIAIASPPPSAASPPSGPLLLEFLVKRLPDPASTASLLCALPPGGALEAGPVQGEGFAVATAAPPAKCPSLLLFAAGSGISPVRALIESPGFKAASESSGRTVRLYYGARSPSAMAYTSRFALWEDAGVSIVPVYSNPSADWKGAKGYVQAAFAADWPVGGKLPGGKAGGGGEAAATGAVLCGQKGMTDEVIKALTVRLWRIRPPCPFLVSFYLLPAALHNFARASDFRAGIVSLGRSGGYRGSRSCRTSEQLC